MELRIFSDLHLEFGDYDIVPLLGDEERILVLAGDIGTPYNTHHREIYVNFIIRACSQFKEVVLVFGNHEYYHGNFQNTKRIFFEGFKEVPINLHLLDNSSWEYGEFVFIGTTLWTSGDKGNPIVGLNWGHMSDSRLISYGENLGKFSFSLMVKEHEFSWQYLRPETKKFSELGKRVIWVNHHGISSKSISPQYIGHFLNPFFISPELEDEILDLQPELIIQGHTHESLEYKIEKTLVVCNPRGYFPDQLNKNFKENLVLKLHKTLKYIGEDPNKKPWFPPDRIGNFDHDAPEDANMIVYDAKGISICGRVSENPKSRWSAVAKNWEFQNTISKTFLGIRKK